MKKRLVCLLMISIMVLSLVACSSNGSAKKESGKTQKKAEDVKSQEDLNEFYQEVDYDLFNDNAFVAVSPLCGISLDTDQLGKGIIAEAPEYGIGNEAFLVFIKYYGENGTVYIEYDPSFELAVNYTEEDIVVNGMDAKKVTLEGADTWYAIIFTGEYEGFHIINNKPSWLPEHEQELFDTLETLVLVKYEQ